MTILLQRFLLLTAMAACMVLSAANAQTTNVTALGSLPGYNDGSYPRGGLVQGSDGNFYGTAPFGGAGVTFRISPTGGYTLLHRFNVADGSDPRAGLILGSDGSFYGTTGQGGASNGGTVFRMTSSGAVATLHSFVGATEGDDPSGALVQGSDGNFYGTASSGGANGTGTIFKVTPAGALTVLHTFSAFDNDSHNTDGAIPSAGLVQCSDGNFYGTCAYAGASNRGTVFRVSPSGVFTALHSFAGGSDGGYPQAALVQGSDGALYGTAPNDGIDNDAGVVFRVTTAGAFSVAYRFTIGEFPAGGLIRGSDGAFYGTTGYGGSNADGSVYRLTMAGGYTVLHSFAGGDGLDPLAALVQGSDGAFYGTAYVGGTNNEGTVFKVDTAGNFATLHSFNAVNSGGATPYAGVVQGADGNFYGTAFRGGANDNGTLFKATLAGAMTSLHDFSALDADRLNSDGALLYAGLALGRDGYFYGVAAGGGASGLGTAFKVSYAGAFTTLHSFGTGDTDTYIEGWSPQAALIQATDGNFYGTTPQAGSYNGGEFGRGTVYRVSATGAQANLFTFNFDDGNGTQPTSSLIQGSDGNLYGTTSFTAFRVTTAGALTNLHTFPDTDDLTNTSTDGSRLVAGLVQGSDGAFYGLAPAGGANGYGTAFRVTASKAFSVLHSFGAADGVQPQGGLVQGADGNFYGTTKYGGSHGMGTVFKITPAGAVTVLHNFDGTQGAFACSTLVRGSDGNLYGTASGGGANGTGTVFMVRLVPSVTSAATAAGQVGLAFSYQITASNTPTSYAATGLPGGLSVNTGTGKITGTPTTAGTFYAYVAASNAFGAGTALLVVTVANPPAPVITSADGATGQVGVPFSYQITATNNPTSYAASPLPDGLSVNASTGLISGTPTGQQIVFGTISATNAGGTGSEDFNVLIQPRPPVITSATTAAGYVGTAFSYQITATNNPSYYTASGLPSGLSLNANSGVISGTPSQTGTSTVSLGAVNAGGTGTATLTLTVSTPPLLPPVITSAASASAVVGSAFSYQIAASHAPASYAASPLPDGLSVDAGSGLISGTPTTAGNYTIGLSATNAAGTGTAALMLAVTTHPLQPPVITGDANAYAVVNATFSYQIVATHSPTGYTATGLPAGLGLDAASGLISGHVAQTGTFTIALSAVNADGTGTATLTLAVTGAPAGAPITWGYPRNVNDDLDVSADSAFERAYVFTRPDGTGPGSTQTINYMPFSVFNADFSSDTLTVGNTTLHATGGQGTVGGYNGLGSKQSPFAGLSSAYREILLPGAYNDNGFLTLTVNNLTPGQLYEIEFFVNDSRAGSTRTASFVAGNVVTLTFNRTAQEGGTGQWVTGTFTADASGSESVTIAPGLPNNYGIPTAQINAFQLRALVDDGLKPVATGAGSVTGYLGAAFTYQITATNHPTAYYIYDTLPTGLSFDGKTGRISGVPTQAGTFYIEYGMYANVSSGGGVGHGYLMLTIASTPPPVPVIVSPAVARAQVGTAFSYQITADNATSYGASGLPNGLSVNAASGLVSGTSTQSGVFTVTLSATNNGGTGTATLTLTVAPPPATYPVITSSTTATVILGQSFSYQITATNSPTSYGARGLPAGLSVNTASGLISGAPTQTGVFNVGLSATNAGGTGTSSLTLTVSPVPVVPPAVTSVLTASAQTTVEFEYQIAAINRPSVYGATGLPADLSINTASGLISGTPTKVGTYRVVLSATNSGGTGTATLTLTVAAAPVVFPTIISDATVSTLLGQSFSYQITATNSPTSFDATDLPEGLSVNPTSGLISGAPTTAGTYSIGLSATNNGGTGTATLVLTVAAAPLPVVSVAAGIPTVMVGSDTYGEFTLTLSEALPENLLVTYAVKGTAVNGEDYALLKGVKKIKAGKTKVQIKVTPLGDLDGAPKKTVKFILESGPGYTIATSHTPVKVKILAGP